MALMNPDPGFWTRTSCIQLTYGIWVNMVSMTIGLGYGFPAVQIPQLNSPDSDILVSTEEASWIASVLTLFCPIGCMISGLLMDRFGRRAMLMWCQAPISIGWLFTGLSGSAKAIIIGRIITGIGCGMAMGPPRLYTAEISLPNMRGLLGALPNIFLALGLTLQAALGSYIPWKKLCYIYSTISFFLFMAFYLLDETPYYLLLRDTSEHARQALVSFRSTNYNIDREMNQLINYKQDNNIRRFASFSLDCKARTRALFRTASLKPFAIIVAFILIVQLSGASIFTFWTTEMLQVFSFAYKVIQLANSVIDPYEGNVYINFTRLTFAIVSSVLIYHVGRRVLAMVSACGVSAACFTVGVFLYHHNDPSIMPLLAFIAYMAFASVGFYYLPFFLMSELYPLQVSIGANKIHHKYFCLVPLIMYSQINPICSSIVVKKARRYILSICKAVVYCNRKAIRSRCYPCIRGTLTGITIAITMFFMFASSKSFVYMRDGIGVANILLMFGGFALFGAIALYMFLPETRGLTLQEIEEYYTKRRSTLSSDRQNQGFDSHSTRKTIKDLSHELHRKSFVEIRKVSSTILATHTDTHDSNKHVTLQVDGHHYRSMTVEEQNQAKNVTEHHDKNVDDVDEEEDEIAVTSLNSEDLSTTSRDKDKSLDHAQTLSLREEVKKEVAKEKQDSKKTGKDY
ncbi:facilitated trehalose transporter Tret1-like [Anticarsia gemmatalis]|uniref:facilitated trehalose transporter Tret1-like n=1 Tax=Anticarsia gemmatalis TaxID=129554 RepID=UPI003F76697F